MDSEMYERDDNWQEMVTPLSEEEEHELEVYMDGVYARLDDADAFEKWVLQMENYYASEHPLGNVNDVNSSANAKNVGDEICNEIAFPGVGRIWYTITRIEENGDVFGKILEEEWDEQYPLPGE